MLTSPKQVSKKSFITIIHITTIIDIIISIIMITITSIITTYFLIITSTIIITIYLIIILLQFLQSLQLFNFSSFVHDVSKKMRLVICYLEQCLTVLCDLYLACKQPFEIPPKKKDNTCQRAMPA